ncbi:unnamed protein product [Ectocarpus sp. CCAP 1310/34]|nr:unnamed protein product [Ectocarpus sp. CCAP 1310/34]
MGAHKLPPRNERPRLWNHRQNSRSSWNNGPSTTRLFGFGTWDAKVDEAGIPTADKRRPTKNFPGRNTNETCIRNPVNSGNGTAVLSSGGDTT